VLGETLPTESNTVLFVGSRNGVKENKQITLLLLYVLSRVKQRWFYDI
jgi:hypothetical protein